MLNLFQHLNKINDQTLNQVQGDRILVGAQPFTKEGNNFLILLCFSLG
jgi:hypothetical protein